MVTKILTVLNSLLIMCFVNCSYGQSSDSAKIAALENFYTSYITENAKMPVNETKVDSIKNKYCTSQFLDSLNNQELDYDPFLNAQECQTNWLNSLLVEKYPNTTNTFKVSYLDSYSNSRIIIKPIVIQAGNEYKIEGIEP